MRSLPHCLPTIAQQTDAVAILPRGFLGSSLQTLISGSNTDWVRWPR